MKTLAAAREVNSLWIESLVVAGIKEVPATAPTDIKVAGVIDKHLSENGNGDEDSNPAAGKLA